MRVPTAIGPRAAILFSAATFLFTFSATAPAQGGTIGLYTDASGSNCSFSGNDPGIVKAYVVVRPGPDGFSAVRFSAPLPSCFGGIFLQDESIAGYATAGDSQTGVSVATGVCGQGPIHVLTIDYFRNGSTDPCCAYPVIPEPGFGDIEAINCASQEVTLIGSTSHFNGNASCQCSASVPPDAPSNPLPLNGDGAVSVFATLSWTGNDYDNDLVDFDVYLGATSAPPLYAAHVTQPTLQPAPALDELTHYYWYVVARDAAGHETTGPTWDFTTRLTNTPPDPPQQGYPGNHALVSGISVPLMWTASDLDHDQLTYDVYLGAELPLTLLATNLHVPTATAPYQHTATGKMYWQVVVHDIHGNQTAGDIWTYDTPAFAHPSQPWAPTPPDGQTNVQNLRAATWNDGFDNGSLTTYDLYVNDVLLAAGLTKPSYDINPFAGTASWYVVAHNQGETRIGDTWRFTEANTSRGTPFSPQPGYLDVVTTPPTLTWSIVNPIPGLQYNVRFGTAPSPPVVATVSQPTFTPAAQPGTLYYWSVETTGSRPISGPTWIFVYGGPQDPVPVLFTKFDAATAANGINVSWQLFSDENAATYTLFRGVPGASKRAVIAEGAEASAGSYLDRSAEPGATYQYQLVVHTVGGSQFQSPLVTAQRASLELALGSNYPNPFNPQTTIPYVVPGSTSLVRVHLAVYDAAGRLVRILIDEDQAGGSREVKWSGVDSAGRGVASGIYFSVLDVGKERRTQKMVLLK